MRPTETADPGNWPPKSPYEAILSSPNGRQKLRARERARSHSTSPLKRARTTPNLLPGKTALRKELEGEDEDEDEDEETLQLKLQAIEAKLKLKKLQGRKTPSQDLYGTENGKLARSPNRFDSELSSRRDGQHKDRDHSRKNSTGGVQVPLSPAKAASPSDAVQRSPSRVLLGIDKGLNGKDVSLRRVPSQRESARGLKDPFIDARDLRSTPNSRFERKTAAETRTPSAGRSFSAKMAEAREREGKEQKQRERLAKMRAERSSAFAVDQKELGAFKQAAAEKPQTDSEQSNPHSQRTYTREDVLKGVSGSEHRQSSVDKTQSQQGCLLPPRSSAPSRIKPESQHSSRPQQQQYHISKKEKPENSTKSSDASIDQPLNETGAPLFDPYSSCNLSRRILPHTFLERTVEDKVPVTIPALLKTIKSPEYLLPDEYVERDFVVFALVASKSSPFEHKKAQRADTKNEVLTSGMEAERSMNNENGKYMCISLTDLKWTLDLFLFGPAFVRFRKLTPGTLIAILNPDIMPPPKRMSDTGRWSLKLSSAEETVLEIGTSKDLGWCKSIKKDGHPCGAWVDLRHTEYCEYHRNMAVEKVRSGRMEVQGMSAPFGPGGRAGSSGSGRGGDWNGRDQNGRFNRGHNNQGSARNGVQFDRSAQSTYFMAGPPGGQGHTAASLLDADEFNIRGGSAARHRELLAAREKEEAMAESLGLIGNGAGAEYLRLRRGIAGANGIHENPSNPLPSNARDAKSLGLTANKSTSILLSPLKRKRISEKPQDVDISARTKKTRFITPKGIREAGRDSLNVHDATTTKGGYIDEDDLDIV